jgi:hypothetical protein
MEQNQELTKLHKGNKFVRPSDGKVVVVTHVDEQEIPNVGPYYEAPLL